MDNFLLRIDRLRDQMAQPHHQQEKCLKVVIIMTVLRDEDITKALVMMGNNLLKQVQKLLVKMILPLKDLTIEKTVLNLEMQEVETQKNQALTEGNQ
jgi:hypothetical protein